MATDPHDTATARARLLFAVAAVAAFVTLVTLGFGMTFFADEWAFIAQRSLDAPSSWLAPHNEHWSTLPVLVYRAMVESVGIGSYVPYLAVVAILHLVVAALVFVILERSSGPVFALIGGVLVLFFGAGFENLYWGFQTTFIGSLAFGLGAMVVADQGPTRFRVPVVAVLLLAAVMCSMIGVIVAIVIGVQWFLERRVRDAITALLLPAGALILWLLAIGRDGVLARDPFSIEAAATVPSYVVQGMGSAVGSIAGLPAVGAGLVIVMVAGLAWRARAGHLATRAIGILIAIAVMYTLIGLARGLIKTDHSELSRYTYISGILVLVALGDIAGRVVIPPVGRRRLLAVSGLTVWLTLAAFHNGALLWLGRDLFLDRADMTRALVTVALDPDPPPGAQLDRSLVLVPSAESLRSLAAMYGDPRGDRLVPFAVRPIRPEILTEATRRLVEGAPIP